MFAGVGLEHGRDPRDFHRFRHHAHLQGHIHALARIHIYGDIRGGELGEAGGLHGNGVAADFHIEEIVIAVFVRSCLGLNSGVLVQKRNVRFRHHRAGVVPNHA
jgi:hypothetical protein